MLDAHRLCSAGRFDGQKLHPLRHHLRRGVVLQEVPLTGRGVLGPVDQAVEQRMQRSHPRPVQRLDRLRMSSCEVGVGCGAEESQRGQR